MKNYREIKDDVARGALELKESNIPGGGIGVFATRFIPSGAPVAEYKGDFYASGENLYEKYKEAGDPRGQYSMKIDGGGVLDCHPRFTKADIGLGGFVNDKHGYEDRSLNSYPSPIGDGYNVLTVQDQETVSRSLSAFHIIKDTSVLETGGIMFATTDIEEGEELYQNYGPDYWRNLSRGYYEEILKQQLET